MPSLEEHPSFTTLPYSSSEEEILRVFDRDGAVILSDFITSPQISSIVSELSLSPGIAAPRPVTALASKSPTLVDEILLSSRLLRIITAKMSKTTRIWHGEERLSNTSRPQLSASVVFDSPAGTPAEPLHRHDDIYFEQHPLEIPVEIWALVNADEKESAGAVDAILGSHKWEEEWDPTGHPLATSTMAPGSCLLLHGSLIHRGGANTSTGLRRTIGVSWTQGHMRQEENQYLNISKEQAMKLNEKTQRLIGYKINAPMGGWYELRDPLTYLQEGQDVDTTMREFTEREGEEIPM